MLLAVLVAPRSRNHYMENSHMDNTTRAERSTIKFCEGVEVDGYRMPNGDFRVGKVGASVAVGYAKNYLTEVEKKSPKQLKALRDAGFTGLEEFVELDHIRGGGTTASTLNLPDFRKLILFAASKGKPQAVALLNAILDTGLEDWFRLSFGQEQLTLEEKRERFYRSYAATINWLEEDRQEWRVIEEQEAFILSMS